MNTLEDLEILCEDETREEFGVRKIRDSYANLRRSHLYLPYFSNTKIDLQHYQLESGRWESHLTYNNKSSKEKVL